MRSPLHVCIVDDDVETRRSLQRCLNGKGIETIAFAAAEAMLESDALDCVGCFVLNIELPGISGLDLQVELRRRNIRAPIVITASRPAVRDAIRAFHDGAKALLDKPFDGNVLVNIVQTNLAAESERHRIADDRDRRLADLSEREHEVLEKLVLGRSIKNIARELGISPSTAEKHRNKVLQKTCLDTVVELTRLMMSGPAAVAPAAPHSRNTLVVT